VVADWVQNAGFFEVNAADFYGTGKLPPPDQGCLLVHHSFHVECGEPVT
jgi:lipopolysaccharide transport system ATP-binding protein